MAVLKIPVTKAGNQILEVDSDSIPDTMFKLALAEGLKVLLNKGMSKIATKGLEGDELDKAKAAAMEIAAKNLDKLNKGEIKVGRTAGATKIAGVVMTEARRLAKEVVKDELKAAGYKISHVEASEITKAANALIEADPSFIETAKANIESRAKKPAAINIAALVHESPKLVAQAAAATAEKKSTLSAKQAGKVAPRKGQSAAPAH